MTNPEQPKDRVQRCLLIARAGDPPMFTATPDGRIVPDLVGYAILPIEDYESLSGKFSPTNPPDESASV